MYMYIQNYFKSYSKCKKYWQEEGTDMYCPTKKYKFFQNEMWCRVEKKVSQ